MSGPMNSTVIPPAPRRRQVDKEGKAPIGWCDGMKEMSVVLVNTKSGLAARRKGLFTQFRYPPPPLPWRKSLSGDQMPWLLVLAALLGPVPSSL